MAEKKVKKEELNEEELKQATGANYEQGEGNKFRCVRKCYSKRYKE